jgi:hypothetical protein
MESVEDVRPGVYEHYRGGKYLLIGFARDDRDETTLVLYVRLYPGKGIPTSARPLDSFLATVNGPGGPQPRFRYLGPEEG